jgi:hypothetical protein
MGDEKCLHSFCGEIRKEDTAWNVYTLKEGNTKMDLKGKE